LTLIPLVLVFCQTSVLGCVAGAESSQHRPWHRGVCQNYPITTRILPGSAVSVSRSDKPNVVLIMTDDQGYGDVACHGNPIVQTPNIERLYGETVRLTNFHVDPTCSPTRSALMTGRYSCRTGVWHTIMGRSLLRRDEVTMADVFAASGYRTGIFGKWHLGDNVPYRPQDRGFQEVLTHGGGGVGQAPDFWDNDYFDDTLRHNGRLEKVSGYCTDVFFNEAISFIESNKDRPFFAYLPTNAPHAPYNVPDAYSRPYRELGVPQPRANFYGMITNIDDNIGRLLSKLDELRLQDNTILIFMTDNGSAAGSNPTTGDGFNAGMRGIKGSAYDGGHRVPFFIRWPAKFKGGRDVSRLTAHIDVLPTLVELCNLESPNVHFDGISLVPLLKGDAATWQDRILFVQSHRIDHPQPWRQSAVMTDRWRLVDGKELFDMNDDPAQQKDVAIDQPAPAAKLHRAYEDWYRDVSRRFDEYCEIAIGSDRENPTQLCCHDWHGEVAPSGQDMVRQAVDANGFWAIDVRKTGMYELTLRQRPAEANYSVEAATARVEIAGMVQTKPVSAGATSVMFRQQLPEGSTRLQTWLTNSDGRTRGAFYVTVERLADSN
jgi:arylsulfatase A-like enzyme